MTEKLILTFIADDRAGLVDRLAKVVVGAGGNWLSSRMAHLGRKFAGFAHVTAPEGVRLRLEAALGALEGEGFHLQVEADPGDVEPSGQIFEVELLGPDHPGIVHEIAQCLAGFGASIEELRSQTREAPMAGGVLFEAAARVRASEMLSEAELREALDTVAGHLMVDIKLAKPE